MALNKISGVLATAISTIAGVATSGISKINNVVLSLFSNTQSLEHGAANVTDAVRAASTSSDFNFTQTDAWSVSFWIKVGWGTSTGSSFHMIASDGGNVHNNMWRVYFNNGNNRLYFGFRSASNQKSNNFVYFHNPGTNEAAYISGLGTSWPSDKWSSSNRGYVTSNGFNLITITKGTDDAASRANVNMYWNSKNLGTLFYANGNNTGTISMDADTGRDWAIGNNSWNLNGQQGNGDATLYDEVSLWNKELSQSEVAEIWNGTDAVGETDGSPINLQNSSMAANLVGYWRFEDSDGTTSTVGNATLTISGNSTINSTVP